MIVYICVCIVVGGIDVDSKTAEYAAVFLFQFVFNSCDMQSSEDSRRKLHPYFGPVSPSLFADICSTVQQIRSYLSDSSAEKISAALHAVTNANQSSIEELFGKNIKLTLDYCSTAGDENLDWLESDDDDVSASGFNMNYTGVSQHVVSQDKIRDTETETVNSKQQKSNGRAWLYEEVASYFGTESSEPETCVDDLVTTVFDILCSSRSNEQLQMEVSRSYCAKCDVNICRKLKCCDWKIVRR